MSNMAVIVLAVALVFVFLFILHVSDEKRRRRLIDKVRRNTAKDALQRTSDQRESDDGHWSEHQIERREGELQMSEFGFRCAQQTTSKEAAYAQAEPVLAALNSKSFSYHVHGAIDDFIASHGQRAPSEQHAACRTARHEREQFQIAHELPLTTFGEDGMHMGTTVAEEMDLVQKKGGEWVHRWS
jgi:heme exporter protein D